MIEIHTFGRTRVAVNGQPLSGEAAWPRSLALIVYMAREPGPDRRDEILGVLWPDREERRARRALNQLLYTLRKASPELDLESVSDALDFGKEVWLDIEEFDRRFESGDLEGAVELYEGPFLADLTLDEPEFDHWADRQRAEARRKFRKAALQLATGAREAGAYEAAVGYCRRLVQVDALDDEAQHLLIECLYLRGDRASALRQYEKYREILERELEVEPLEHTELLVARIRGEAPAAEETVESESGTSPGSVTLGEATDETSEAPDREPEVAERVRAELEPAEPARYRRSLASVAGSHALVGVGGVILGAMLAIWLWPGLAAVDREAIGSDEASAGAVAVAPFEVHGDVGGVDGVGVAQLLNLELSEDGSLPTVPHRTLMRRWRGSESERAATSGAGRAVEVASALGASQLAMGDVHAAGADLRIVVDLIATESGELIASADVRGSRDELFELVERAAGALRASASTAADRMQGGVSR